MVLIELPRRQESLTIVRLLDPNHQESPEPLEQVPEMLTVESSPEVPEPFSSQQIVVDHTVNDPGLASDDDDDVQFVISVPRRKRRKRKRTKNGPQTRSIPNTGLNQSRGLTRSKPSEAGILDSVVVPRQSSRSSRSQNLPEATEGIVKQSLSSRGALDRTSLPEVTPPSQSCLNGHGTSSHVAYTSSQQSWWRPSDSGHGPRFDSSSTVMGTGSLQDVSPPIKRMRQESLNMKRSHDQQSRPVSPRTTTHSWLTALPNPRAETPLSPDSMWSADCDSNNNILVDQQVQPNRSFTTSRNSTDTSTAASNIPSQSHAISAPSVQQIRQSHNRRSTLYQIPEWSGPPSIPRIRMLPPTSAPDSRSNTYSNSANRAPIPRSVPPRILANEEATILFPPTAPPGPRTHSNNDFRIPSSRAGRKYSPNLIVDIAETCQDNFPFAQVASRHNVPIKRVFDTFSAIIQLPLLRNAEDKRRYGSLARRRLKDFKDVQRMVAEEEEKRREN